MTILMPEGREWDQPVLMADDPFTYFVENEASIQKLEDDGMPKHCIREIRQDTDAQLIDWHEGLMRVAAITGQTDPKLFGWGDIDFYSTTTKEDPLAPLTQAQQELAATQEKLAETQGELAFVRKRLTRVTWAYLAAQTAMLALLAANLLKAHGL